MQMHEDESEVKYFTKFLRPYLRPDCNIVTLGMLKLASSLLCRIGYLKFVPPKRTLNKYDSEIRIWVSSIEFYRVDFAIELFFIEMPI